MLAILLLCLVGVALSQQPAPCITPPQWEANIFDVNESQGFMVRGRLSYDATFHREHVVEEVDVGRQDTAYDVLALFDAQIEYVYDFKFRNCSHRRLDRPWRNFGVPPNAVSLGEGYVGTSAIPGAGVLVSLWGGNHTTPMNDTVRTFGSWTYQACLPVQHVSYSSRYGRSQTQFFDITAGIRDPNVFIPRRECLTEKEYAMRHVLFGTPVTKNEN